MIWRSSKQSLKPKRRIPKRKINLGPTGLGLAERIQIPTPIEEIRRLGQGMVLTSLAFRQGARSPQPARGRRGRGPAAPEETVESSRPARRGATQ